MSELKTPTISGLVEKLYDKNYIEDKEKDAIKAILEQSTSGMEKDDITLLITKLNAKIDAHSSDLITQNRLNYASFDDAIKTSTREIKKEKAERQKSQANATVDPLQENKNIEKTPQEQAEIERQQRIAENKNYLEGLLKSIPGAEKLRLTDETLTKVAETMQRQDEYYERVQNLVDSKQYSKKEAESVVRQELGITQEDLNSKESVTSQEIWLAKEIENGNNRGETAQETISRLRKEHSIRMGALEKIRGMKELVDGVATGILDAGSALKKTILESFSDLSITEEKNIIENIEANESIIRSSIYDRKITDIRILKESIFFIVEKERELVQKKNKNDGPMTKEEEKKQKIFFERLTKMYLASDVTISELYDRLEHNNRVKRQDMRFEDFLVGITENLKKDNTASKKDIGKLIYYERKIRQADFLEKAIKKATENGNKIVPEDELKKEKIEEEKNRKSQKIIKEACAVKRGIEYKKDVNKKHRSEDLRNRRKISTTEQLENDISRITNDRKRILEIAKDRGISSDEASRIYFSKNIIAFNLYTKREKRIIMGKNISKEKEGRPNNILKKLKYIMKEKNDKLISIYTADVELFTKKIKDSSYSPVNLEKLLEELNKKKRMLRNVQERNRKLEEKQKIKTAMGIIDKKSRQVAEKEIFKRYLESGKSAMELLEELNSGENKNTYTREYIIEIIKDNSRKYLKPGELSIFIRNEKMIFFHNDQISDFIIRKNNSEKIGRYNLFERYNNEIKKNESSQSDYTKENKKYKEMILIRMGLNPNEIGRTDGTTQIAENGQVVDSEEIKTNSGAAVVQGQEEQTEERKNGLAIEELEVTGVKPNVKAIAKKSKVTPSRVKKVFAKIVGLGKSKEKVAEQNEQDTSSEEKSNKISTESGAR